MKHFYISIITFSIVALCSGQEVFNIESLREATDKKWTGSLGLNIGLIKNVNDVFWLSNNAHIQYKDSTNYWLLYSNLSFQKLDGESFVNRGTQHLLMKVSNLKLLCNHNMMPYLKLILEDWQGLDLDLN